jgi:hypothetical protein
MKSMRAAHGSDEDIAFEMQRPQAENACRREPAMLTMNLTLAPSESATIAPACDMRLRCTQGMLWLVGDCTREDLVLEAGDSAPLRAAETLVLSSVMRKEAVSFELCMPLALGSSHSFGPRWLAHCLRQFL